MATYDSLRTLPLHIDGYYLEPLEREVARGFTLRRTVDRAARPRRGRAGARRSTTTRRSRRGSRSRAARCRSPASTRSSRSRCSSRARPSTGAGRSSRPRSTSRSGRRGCRSARRSGGRRSRFGSSSRPAWPAVPRWLELYPELRFKLDPGTDWTDEIVAALAATGRVDTVDFKGIYPRRVRRAAGPELYRRIVDGLSRRMDRGPRADAGDLGGPRRAPRPHHVGRGDPRVERTSKRCRSRRVRSTASRHGSAR